VSQDPPSPTSSRWSLTVGRRIAAVSAAISFAAAAGLAITIVEARSISSKAHEALTSAGGTGDVQPIVDSADFAVNVSIASFIVMVVLGSVLPFFLARSISRPLRRLRDSAQQAADGDLTVSAASTGTDEVAQVSRAVDAMLVNFRGIVGQVTHSATAQSAAARDTVEATRLSGQAVAEIAATVEDIARGASDQAESSQAVADTIDEMARTMAEVAAGRDAAGEAARAAGAAAEDGSHIVARSTQAIGRVAERVESASTVVTGLGEKGGAIGAIVGTIDQIASQTNLLALNAAIEAARAGEHGRGFAVVADEVRKLAEESKKAAASIAEIVRDIQSETGKAVEAMSAGRDEVEIGVSSVSDAGEAFSAILEAILQLRSKVEESTAASQELEAGVDHVQQQVASVAAVSEENAASAQEVSASTAETSAATDRVLAAAEQVSRDADEMIALVSRFTV
jgi:methyl-accepting chemotaxis protein